jgi:hypothetical protein
VLLLLVSIRQTALCGTVRGNLIPVCSSAERQRNTLSTFTEAIGCGRTSGFDYRSEWHFRVRRLLRSRLALLFIMPA